MDDILAVIEKEKKKIEDYLDSKKKDVAILKQVLEPVTESTDNLTDVMKELVEVEGKERAYFDKDFNKKVIDVINKILAAFQSYKQLDMSGIATEMGRGNDNIVKLLSTPNQSDEVIRMLSAFLNKQTIAFEKITKEINYSPQLDKLIEAVGKKDRVDEITFIYGDGGVIKKAVATYKK